MSRSKSSSRQQTTQETTQQGVEGTIGSTVLQGSDISYTEQFPERVADAFSELIDFAAGAGEAAVAIGDKAIGTVADTRFKSEAPSLAIQENLIPIVIGAAGLVAIVLILRG